MTALLGLKRFIWNKMKYSNYYHSICAVLYLWRLVITILDEQYCFYNK